MHKEFDTLLSSSQPPKEVFAAARALFREVWDKRLSQVTHIRKTLKADIKQIDKQIEQVLETH